MHAAAGVLGLYVRGCGPVLGRRFMLTKTLEWNLFACVLDPMFDEHFHIRQVRAETCTCLLTFVVYVCLLDPPFDEHFHIRQVRCRFQG